jgi:methylthioribose-1-phosphate isomerase
MEKMMRSPVSWQVEAGHLELLDQRRLPATEDWIVCRDSAAVADAIRDMVVRGAPAIGIAAAWGAVLAIREAASASEWRDDCERRLDLLAAARPTAVNLNWAVTRMREKVAAVESPEAAVSACEKLAAEIESDDLAANRRIGELGSRLLPAGTRVLTHCNTGALATGGHGTALGIIRTAWQQGGLTVVIATETRPWLQGARLTSWELAHDGIPVTVIVDSAAAWMMRTGEVDAVVIGADRITRRGDVANKIGSYSLALAAQAHGIPFIVAAPSSTVDSNLEDGNDNEIEDRDPAEIWRATGLDGAPEGVKTRNPAFDVTPAELVAAIVTERGVASPATDRGMDILKGAA